jgi:glycine cleavage system aminomethyltransferase T
MKRSALFYLHQRSGAKFAECHGWEMPFSFASPEAEESQVRRHAGVADLSYRQKFDTRKEPAGPFWILGKNHFLVVGEPPLAPPPEATDVTSVFANLFLAGPQSRVVLSKLTSLNISQDKLPDLSCAQANLAHVHAIVLREDFRSISGFHILVGREYGESVWEAIVHAGHEFHLRPFGLEALRLLR